ncbi:MAG: TPR end-of-group domain-containing protein [Acidobacteriota bacterium]
MNVRRIFGTAWVCLAGAGLWAAQKLPDDLRRLTPESLGARPAGEIQRQAEEAYRARDYVESARAYAELLRRRPNAPLALYNLSCCYALLGAADKAGLFLEAAFAAGLEDLALPDRDPDFDGVRGAPSFQASLKSARERAAQREPKEGRRIEFPARAMERMTVLEPEGYDPARAYPLVIGLHGAGSSPEEFAPFFGPAFRKAGVLFCTPQGQYPVAVAAERPIGYLWFEAEAGTDRRVPRPASRKLAEEYVTAVLEAVKTTHKVDMDRVYLMGFSQGAFLAYSAGIRGGGAFRGVIPIGGWLTPGDFSPQEISAARASEFLVCHSPQDQGIPMAECETSVEFLRKGGVPVSLFTYEGGHVISPPLVRKITDWISETSRR